MSAKAVSDALKKMFKAKDRSEQLGAANSSYLPDVDMDVEDPIPKTGVCEDPLEDLVASSEFSSAAPSQNDEHGPPAAANLQPKTLFLTAMTQPRSIRLLPSPGKNLRMHWGVARTI